MGVRPRIRASRTYLTLLVLVLLLAAGAAAAGCGGETGTSGDGGIAGASPKAGGAINIAFQSEPVTLDPAISWDVAGWTVEDSVFNALYRYAPKAGAEGTELIPDLAVDMPEISADGTTYTIKLRPDAKFAPPVDRAVTAEDVKYSFERMMTEPRCPATYFYEGVEGASDAVAGKTRTISGVTVVDPQTIEFKLTSPDLSFLYALSMEFCDVVPKEWVAKWGKQVNRHPLGTGPFYMDTWTTGREIKLLKNPNYWNASKVSLDGVDFTFNLTPSNALLKLERGEVDILGDNIPPADVARVTNDPQWKPYVYSQPLIATTYLFMNSTKEPFDDVKVRQALSWAIDRDKLVKLQSGQAVSLYQIYPQNLPGSEPGKVYYGYDPAKAKTLLAEAGYPDGFKTVVYTSNVDPMPKLVQSMQADLKAIGVDAEIKTMDRATYYNFSSDAAKTELGTSDWFLDFPDPVDWIVPFFTEANAVQGGLNTAYYVDPWVEQATGEAQKMTDPEARLAKYTEIQQHIMEQAPYVTLYSPVMTTMCSKNVGGFYLHPVLWFDPLMYWRK
jgi:peptide/nickel transport system substrate-binding protein/oligopeptide transport system substrate-binding protein